MVGFACYQIVSIESYMTEDFPFQQFLNTDHQPPRHFNDLLNNEDKLTKEKSILSADLSHCQNQILAILAEEIPPSKFQTYFEDTLKLVSYTEEKVIINVFKPFLKIMMETHYLPQISAAIQKVFKKRKTIEIIAEASNSSLENQTSNLQKSFVTQQAPSSFPPAVKSVKDASFRLDLTPSTDDLMTSIESKYVSHVKDEPKSFLALDPAKCFDSFIVGPSNNLAFATSVAAGKEPSRTGIPGRYPSLYIHSNSGLGKTHLLHAIGNSIKTKYPDLTVVLISAREFMKEMINSIQEQNLPEFQKKYAERTDVLLLDDIHELSNKTGTQNEFFHIFNELHNRGKQLIFTSDQRPTDIKGIAERLTTRLQWGLVIDIQKPDLETRVAILKRKAYELNLLLSDDILHAIACSIKSSIRELEGALIKLSAFSEVMKSNLDMENVRNLLHINMEDKNKDLGLDTIGKAVASHYKILIADLKSKSRTKDITLARHLAMYLSQKILNATLFEIGTYYGGRDHTSVIHAIKKITSQLKDDHLLSKDIVYIESNL